jgi:hypothetical protein
MKKTTLLAIICLMALGSLGIANGGSIYNIGLSACRTPGGRYNVTVTAFHDGSFWADFHTIDPARPTGAWGDDSQCHGSVPNGWTRVFQGIPEGLTFSAYFWMYPSSSFRSIKLDSSLPPCTGQPLFNMYLLTAGDSACILMSDTFPSVERQNALCFPGTDWVAEASPCSGPVYSNDYWVCDSFGFERLPLKDLRQIHMNRMSRME